MQKYSSATKVTSIPTGIPKRTLKGLLRSGSYFCIYVEDTLADARSSYNELVLIGIWMILGLIMALWAKKDFGRISIREREVLIFGEKLARRNNR